MSFFTAVMIFATAVPSVLQAQYKEPEKKDSLTGLILPITMNIRLQVMTVTEVERTITSKKEIL